MDMVVEELAQQQKQQPPLQLQLPTNIQAIEMNTKGQRQQGQQSNEIGAKIHQMEAGLHNMEEKLSLFRITFDQQKEDRKSKRDCRSLLSWF